MNKKEYLKEWKKRNKDKVNRYRIKWRNNDENRRKEAEQKKKVRPIRSNNERTKLKELREYKGNKCALCGYNDIPKILHFHHLKDKLFEISKRRYLSLENLKREANKCILVCPNCHAIIHLNNKTQ